METVSRAPLSDCAAGGKYTLAQFGELQEKMELLENRGHQSPVYTVNEFSCQISITATLDLFLLK